MIIKPSLIVVFCFFAFSAHANLLTDKAKAKNTVTNISEKIELSEDARIQYAKYADPEWIRIKSPSTISQLIEFICDKQSESMKAFLLEQALKINNVPYANTKIDTGAIIAIPFCKEITDFIGVIIQPGDTIEKILRRNNIRYDLQKAEIIFKLNRENYESLKSFEKNLKPGIEILIPYKNLESSLEFPILPISQKISNISEIDNFSETQVAYSIPVTDNFNAETQTTSIYAEEDNINFDYIYYVSEDDIKMSDNCKLEEEEPPYQVFDYSILISRLSEEAKAIEKNIEQLSYSTVGIIDSGINWKLIESGKEDFFRIAHFKSNEREKKDKKDNDGNGKIDDIYGINFNNNNGNIDYYLGTEKFDHGTKVASLVLGGYDFVRQQQLNNQNPLVKLKIVNFSSNSPNQSTVAAPYLHEAIDYLESQGVRIINMSLIGSHNVYSLDDMINKHDSVLYVVAAGNSLVGWNISQKRAYPARYGGGKGKYSDRVITVGAYNKLGKRAHFSNYSKDYVDLLAPGCGIKVRGVKNDFEISHGTSYSTAIVSFTAALIEALGGDSKIIKSRLIAGVDVDPDLMHQTWTSGRLNIVKSISVSHDVIEMIEKEEPYRFGKIDVKKLIDFCDDPIEKSNLVSLDIIKIRPNITENKAFKIEYWVRSDKSDMAIDKIQCNQINSQHSFDELNIVFSQGKNESVALNKIRDIIIRTNE